jgi:penicillin amidase
MPGTAWDAPLFGEPFAAPVLPAGFGAGAGEAQAVTAIGAPEADVPGSNNFAVSGALTGDGRALVANDMHLGLRVPSLWFRARLRHPDPAVQGGAVDVSGLTLPGVPGVIAGSNGHIAWGFTNSYGDWVDWVEVEWLDDGRRRYRTGDGDAEAVVHAERIEVAGAEADVLEVVETRWGPVLHDDGEGRALALAWTAHRPGAVDFTLGDLAGARSVDAAVAIAQRSGMPAQNLVVGDADGRIAWTLTGRIPRRTGACDPQLPLQPARGCEWDGWVAPEQAPRLMDPANQRLWTANARVLDGTGLALVGDGGYDLGARQRQVRDDLFARERFDEQALLDIQLDDRALFLERWWALLREVGEDPAWADDARIRQLADASAVWNGRAAVDSASYRLARAFRLEVHDALYDRLMAPARAAEGEGFRAPRLPQFEGVVWTLLEQRPGALPGSGAVDWPLLLADAARAVVDDLSRHGDDLSMRTWGERNTAAIAHPLSGALPGWMASALDMPAQPLPGDSNMPRVQSPTFGASQRFVVAPGREDRGLMHVPGGASGHPLSPFHGAGHADWVEGRPSPFLPGPAVHRLELQPAGP